MPATVLWDLHIQCDSGIEKGESVGLMDRYFASDFALTRTLADDTES